MFISKCPWFNVIATFEQKKKWHEDIAVWFNSDYLAPLPTQKMLLCSYDEDMKQMVSGELPTHPSLSQRNT